MFDDVQVDGKLVQENFVDGDKTQNGLGDEGYKLTYRVDARDAVATVSPHLRRRLCLCLVLVPLLVRHSKVPQASPMSGGSPAFAT